MTGEGWGLGVGEEVGASERDGSEVGVRDDLSRPGEGEDEQRVRKGIGMGVTLDWYRS